MNKGPYLIIAAFWQETDNTDEVAAAIPRSMFPEPDGWPHGQVVAFRREIATSLEFRRDLRRFDLDELNATPSEREAVSPTIGTAA